MLFVKVLADAVSDDYSFMCLLVLFATLFVLLQLTVIALSRFAVTPVNGISMDPFIKDGDLIIKRRLLHGNEKSLRVGDIITFERDGVKCIKRVVGVGVSSLS